MVVRHPFLRFVSAYKDRIGNPNYKGTEELRADILKETALSRSEYVEKTEIESKSMFGNIMDWFGFREDRDDVRREVKELNIDDEGEEREKGEQVPTFDQFVEYFERHHSEMRGNKSAIKGTNLRDMKNSPSCLAKILKIPDQKFPPS